MQPDNVSKSWSRGRRNRSVSWFDPPRNDIAKGRVCSGGNFEEKFSGKMKVMLSPGKIHMPEVGRQKRKFGIQILAVLIPPS